MKQYLSLFAILLIPFFTKGQDVKTPKFDPLQFENWDSLYSVLNEELDKDMVFPKDTIKKDLVYIDDTELFVYFHGC
jgi:hypothetical protein